MIRFSQWLASDRTAALLLFFALLPAYGIAGYWLVSAALPLDQMIDDPIALNSPLPAGRVSVLRTQWHYEKLRDCDSRFERRVTSDIEVFVLPESSGTNEPLGVSKWVGSTRLPALPPGAYEYYSRGFFRCGWLPWQIKRDYPAVQFVVE